MSSFLKRTISGALFIVLIIGGIILGRFSFFIVFFVLMELTLLEFFRITFKARVKPQYLYGMVLGGLIFIMNHLFAIGMLGHYIFLGIIPLILSIFLIELYRNHQKPIHNIAFTLLGIIYVAIPFSLLNYFALSYSSYHIGYKTHILLGYFIMLWANDSGAYVVGLSIGKNRLFPRISPKKSWEGLVGGLFFTVLASWILSLVFIELSFFHWAVIGLITATTGIFGDLVESMFKRSVGVKDSGKIMPGHGGLLDRFDCVLISAPIVFVYLEIMMLI
ncbi:MAG: phosphatidate cytidylyltransferase [Tenuifilaceae bacterium]|uniref:phosphatidate cytidylyltransferase n=1 Tax=Perlabentimonas gracilis TaxID=2715279 RepID=UPI00140D19EF|nr:phosphatidate cytidylyltransferase [Perlabentimonas gracilis]MDX9770410.1 phosphatidate cytidylyltransferase [Tenuifilaceae bacterium]NHB68268.1 phosphatidate cytidylyltransferase [Perlabentimonas gracilis]